MTNEARRRPRRASAIAFACAVVLTAAPAAAQTRAPEATLFRVFLTDGTTLVSYGEYARVADRVVISLPISGAEAPPRLQMVSIPATAVDWDRTDAYTEAARAARYAAASGGNDYALLTEAVARALNEIALTKDVRRRLAMATEARRNVLRWPADHFGYRSSDVAELAELFDEAISDAKAASGDRSFDLSLVANTSGPPAVALMLPPSPREQAEEALRAAALTTDASERRSLLEAIADSLAGSAATEDWAVRARARAAADLAVERRTDEAYGALTRDLAGTADARARTGDVRAVERLIRRAVESDDRLGRRRPQEAAALLAFLDSKLDVARRMRLARDQWAERSEVLRKYEKAIAEPASLMRASRGWLEQIKDLAGPSRRALDRLQGRVSLAARLLALVKPPVEVEAAQSLLANALRMAVRAAIARQRAIDTGDMSLAWQASSAAAGALMLFQRASEEIERFSRAPEPK